MNILLLTDHFLPNIGGGEFIAHYWADALTRKGHKVIVPTLRPAFRSYNETMVFPYEVHRAPFIPFQPTLSSLLQFYRIHRKHKIDIIHANFLYRAGYVGVKLQEIFKVPCVASGQGADILIYEPLHYGNLLDLKILEKTKHVVKLLSGFIYNCQKVRTRFLELGGQEEITHHVYNGSPYKDIRSDRRITIRRELGVNENDILFVAVSRNSKIKGLHLLIDAVEKLKHHPQPFKVLLIGPHTEQLNEPICRRGLSSFFHIEGEVPFEIDKKTNIPKMPTQHIVDNLCASDVFISPALSGTFELSASDAMSAGLAVIVSDNIGNRDVVYNGDNGFVTENNNSDSIASAMGNFLDNPLLAQVMGKKNKEIAKQFDWDTIAEKLEAVYEKTVQRWNKLRLK
ncbi:glycosyltransferase family 4 protein [bacterium]|nr:glycosyltransferase family 4 protein [bacterium]